MPKANVKFRDIGNGFNTCRYWIPFDRTSPLVPPVDYKKPDNTVNTVTFGPQGNSMLIEIADKKYLCIKNLKGQSTGKIDAVKSLEICRLQSIDLKYLPVNAKTSVCSLLCEDNGYLNFFCDRDGNNIFAGERGRSIKDNLLLKMQ